MTVSIFGSGSVTSQLVTLTAEEPKSIELMAESFQVSKSIRWLFLYHLWGTYWSLHFILSLGEMVTAITVADWYFSRKGEAPSIVRKLRRPNPVLSAMQSSMYHLGTIAFSSAISSLVRLSRSVYIKVREQGEFPAGTSIQMFTQCCCVSWLALMALVFESSRGCVVLYMVL